MRKNFREARGGQETGLTLVELIVYSLLLIVIMGIAATVFIQMLTVQRDVRAITDANNTAQLTFRELERDLRNAHWAVVDHGGRLLVMQTRIATASGDTSTLCTGFYYDADSDALRRTARPDSNQTAPVLAAVDTSSLDALASSWEIVRDGVGQVGGSPVFGPVDQEIVAPSYVSIHMDAETLEGRSPIEFQKSVALRPQGSTVVGCD
ncbi:PilW family protein [Demequina sp. SO4-13]|uniref:PilW family protein n=1 Tax=Demequina sp. SO4-13 TaxID=3401027 RepID=UPI003AF95E3F